MGATKSTQEQTNVKDTNNTECLIERINIEDTPFTIIKTDKGSFGTLGKYRITETGTEEEIRKELITITWNRIVQVLTLITEELLNGINNVKE